MDALRVGKLRNGAMHALRHALGALRHSTDKHARLKAFV
jgi:hypothetical protein